MKFYWLLIGLAVVTGSVSAWAYNYNRYGSREGRLGAITMDGTINGKNVMAEVAKGYSTSLAKVEMLNDPTFDFGAMAPGTKGNHTFTVKNVGGEPLTLELGATTCKCTLGKLANSSLAPGETTDIELEWNVSAGKTTFEQSAQVRTNDPMRPAIDFKISGLVLREMEIEPRELTFGSVASGDPFEFDFKIYSYMDEKIVPDSQAFASEELTKLTQFEVTEFEPSEADGVHKSAKQGFAIKAKVGSGMRQGAVSTNFLFGFQKLDENGDVISTEESTKEKGDKYYFTASAAGRVIGSLSMLEGQKVKSVSGGGYVFDFGKLGPEDSTIGKSFVVLKGSEKDATNLTIGESYPDDVIQAKLGDPIGRGSMKMYPLTLEVIVGEKPIELSGKNKDEYGWVWIESDNPKVSRMKLAVKVAAQPRP
ncbi:DUF1573 domain-containing protein [Stieleria varia]|uniref:DUF1573 domain-containing protein n=1 Tax=Stieleria varia TaxID=2528005 RepID=UPI0011B68C78|nr:DUF1573 domain-containing protein [Stieleria varia]